VTVHASEAWVDAPLQTFLDDSRVRIAVLMHPSGQVLAQSGFAQSADVMTACALAAAINASAGELGRQLDGKPFAGLHFAGRASQIFLGVVTGVRGGLLLLAVFDDTTSLGLVQIFFEEFRARMESSAPPEMPAEPALNADFEGDLNRNLAALFGRP
jgi:hypothetical protein